MDEIISLVTASPTDQYLIGVWDLDDGVQGNLDGSTFDYDNFASGMPVAENGDHCVVLNDASGEWVDASCENEYKFICQTYGIPNNLMAEYEYNSGPETFAAAEAIC